MADKNRKDDGFDQSRRTLLKYVVPGLLSGFAAPAILRLPGAHAAGSALQNKKILIVYYSRTGSTRTVANHIHAMVGGDIVELQTVNPYPAEYRATTRQAKEELESGYKPPLKTKIENLDAYDVVFVGSPCWWGTIATPVITFLSESSMAGKTVVPFMTHKGSGLGRTMSHVMSLCPKATVLKGIAIWGDEAQSAQDDVSAWLREIGMAG